MVCLAKTKYFLSYFLLILLLQQIAFTRSLFAEDDTQIWSAFMATGKFYPLSNWRWYAEAQPRIGDNASYPERLLVRPSIGYQVAPNLVLWMGYGWTPLFMNSKYEHRFNDEHRIWQQVTYDHLIGSLLINHRLRLEERFVEGVYGETTRLRYLLRFSQPLHTLASGDVLGLTAYDEYFYNLSQVSPSIKSGYDRNRIFFGSYWDNQKVRIDFGYLQETSDRVNNSNRKLKIFAAYLTFRF